MKHEPPFVFGCSLEVFPPEEIDALTTEGARLEYLAAGTDPTNAVERHFVEVLRGDAEPNSVAERAWLRLMARRELEHGEQSKPPADTATAKDYGMVEFDADRCWW